MPQEKRSNFMVHGENGSCVLWSLVVFQRDLMTLSLVPSSHQETFLTKLSLSPYFRRHRFMRPMREASFPERFISFLNDTKL